VIIRILKTLVFGTVAYHAARRASAQVKLLRIRAEAKEEMDNHQSILRQLFAQSGDYAGLSEGERARLWDIHFHQHTKWAKVHAKTL
jgi:hypothetical protein